MADQRLKDLRGPGRRDFLRWSATVAAVLGLERARFLEALSGSSGVAMADSAACSTTARSFHIVAGNGGLAHFNLVFPHNEIAKTANGNYGIHNPGSGTLIPGTDKPIYRMAESPFKTLSPKRQISAFMAGNTEAQHTDTPQAASTIATGVGMIAAIAAIQQANPTLLPVIGINPLVYGVAAGAPQVATVANAAGLVELFNSAASKTLLSTSSNASLNEAYYKAFLGLNAAAGRPSTARGYTVGKVAANLLGQNLAEQLRPTAADDAMYGVSAQSPTAIVEIAHAMITAIKAFKLGLTSSVIVPAFRDDPHGMFAGGDAEAQASALAIGKLFDGFLAHAAATADPSCSGKSLDQNLVITIHGDTPKDPLQRSGWPDGTPDNSNWLYVFGNGYVKTGWFGGVGAGGAVSGYNPATGADVPGQSSAATATAAAAAAAYAVAKGDLRRVQDFYRGGDFSGTVNPQQL